MEKKINNFKVLAFQLLNKIPSQHICIFSFKKVLKKMSEIFPFSIDLLCKQSSSFIMNPS